MDEFITIFSYEEIINEAIECTTVQITDQINTITLDIIDQVLSSSSTNRLLFTSLLMDVILLNINYNVQ